MLLRRLGLLIFAAGAVALVGCSDLGNPIRPKPVPLLSVTSLDFGAVAVSGTATRSVTVGNSGSAALTGTAAVSCADYQLIAGGGPFSIAPGESRSITIQFAPGAVGPAPCTLDLGPNCPQVTILGTGAVQAPGALCAVTPDHLDFGAVSVGQTNSAAFQVLSAGTAPLLVNVVSTNDDYRIVSGGGLMEIPAGGFRTVVVEFRPQGGRDRPGTIAVGPGCPDVPTDGLGISVSLRNDIRPILNASCTQSCHFHYFNDPVSGNDNLRTNINYIVPFDTTRSFLYVRITGVFSQYFGGRFPMPPTGPLIPVSDQDKFRDWILEGLQDN